MTATVATPLPGKEGLGGEGGAVGVARALAWRNIRLVARIPSAFVPATLFPIFLIIAFSGAFSAITALPAFPTDIILNWYVPLATVQGSAFIGVGTGIGTTRDIETGFFDRLLLAPASRVGLIVGPVLGAAARALLPFLVVVAVGFLGGARLEGSALGLLALLAAGVGTCTFHAFWCLGIAYRARSQRAAPLMQIGVFVTIFLATAQVPLSVMTGWLKSVARVNPMTNVLRLARAGFVGGDGVTWAECWGGLVVLVVAVTLAFLWSARGFRKLVP